MASKIGGLYYSIGANAAQLYAELNKSKKSIGKFAQSARSGINQAGRAFGYMGVAAAGAAAVIVKSQLAAIDALAKTSDKLGITTKNLAGLQLAAKITGVEQETLNKALVKQQKAVADANNGLETYARQFRALGIDTQKLANLNPAEQFKVIADALNKVENQTLKTSIAYDLFGGRGTALLNTVKLGSAGLNAFEEEAVDLGIAVTRIDAAKIEAANDAIARAGAAAEGVGNKITVALAPYITAVADKLAEAAKNGETFGITVGGAMESVGNAVAFVADAYNGIVVAMKLAQAVGLSVGQVIVFGYEAIAEAIDTITGAMLEAIQSVFNAGANLPDWAGGDAFKGVSDSIGNIRQDMAETTDAIKQFWVAMGEDATAAWQSFDEAVMAAPPGEAIKQQFFEIEQAATRAAAAIAESANASVNTDTGDASATALAPMDNELFQAQLDQRLALQIAHSEAAAAADLAIEQALDAQKLEGRMLTDELLLTMAQEQAYAKVLAEFEAEQAAKGELGIATTDEQKIELQKKLGDESLRIAGDIAKRRADIAKKENDLLQKADLKTFDGKANTLSATLTLTSMFGKKSAALQKASALANKAIALKDAIVSTAQGVAGALRDVPFPASIAAAAAVGIIGAAQIATIAGAGGGGGGGGGSAPSFSSGSTPSYAGNVADDPEIQQRQAQSSVQIIVQGDVNGVDSYLEEKLIPAFQSAIQERDLVFISGDSRQAQEIAGAA